MQQWIPAVAAFEAGLFAILQEVGGRDATVLVGAVDQREGVVAAALGALVDVQRLEARDVGDARLDLFDEAAAGGVEVVEFLELDPGDADAQHQLARLYLDGRGVEKNTARALELYRQAARGGDISARLELAETYSEGEGVARDPGRAYFWYVVLDQTRSFAIRMYADAARTALEEETSDATLAQARKDAAAWLAQHGEASK